MKLFDEGRVGRFTMRHRSAPRAGTHAVVGGWFELQLINREGRVVQGAEFHNLFLDGGLNRIGQVVMSSQAWATHCGVGTGPSEPTPGDGGLEAQLARTGTLSDTGGVNVDVGSATYTYYRTWEFGYDQGNGNLTEVGIFGGATGNPIARELIRDVNGDPIVVTKTNEFLLRITYSWTLTLTPGLTNYTPGTLDIAGIGQVGVNWGWHRARHADAPRAAFAYIAAGAQAGGVRGVGSPFLSVLAPSSPADVQDFSPTSVTGEGNRVASAFTPGVWERSISATFPTTIVRSDIRSLCVSGATGNIGGQANRVEPGAIIVIADAGDAIDMDGDHRLVVPDLFTVTWGRA